MSGCIALQDGFVQLCARLGGAVAGLRKPPSSDHLVVPNLNYCAFCWDEMFSDGTVGLCKLDIVIENAILGS